MPSLQLGAELNAVQVVDIAAFLGALTGERPRITQPILPVRTDAAPLPAPM